MATTPVTVKIRVSKPEPQVLVDFDYFYGTHQILADGTELWSNRGNKTVLLKKTVVIEEIRGYTSDPSADFQNSAHYTPLPVYGEGNKLLGTYNYADTEITYECARINEAGFWRVTKTTTTATPEEQTE